MCNLYHMAPRDHVERYFRAMGLLAAPPAERLDQSDAQRTDQLLGQQTGR